MAEKKKILYIVEAMGGGVFTYIYRSKKSKGELYKHAICKAQIIVSYVKHSTYFT